MPAIERMRAGGTNLVDRLRRPARRTPDAKALRLQFAERPAGCSATYGAAEDRADLLRHAEAEDVEDASVDRCYRPHGIGDTLLSVLAVRSPEISQTVLDGLARRGEAERVTAGCEVEAAFAVESTFHDGCFEG